MTDGPYDTITAILGLTIVTIYALSRGTLDIAYTSTAALAAYLGAKVIARSRLSEA